MAAHSGGDISGFGGGDGVADDQWQRVRAMAERVAALEEAVAEMIDPDPDSLARLDRARIKAARAAQRAKLADELAEALEDMRAARRRPRR
ncbi:MAG TPA: hypothetical protein PLV41_06855 [Miltoncostaeales bacterium]|jgi:hypothetical protein|nr:hypothetical protein [Miltoncostaeales bacterium]